MTKVVYKLFVDFEKEEAWLNSMASKGWNLTSYTPLRYKFAKGTPNTYTYRIEMLESIPGTKACDEYIKFMEDAGVEHIQNYFGWAFFRMKTNGEEFEIYSDVESKLNHLKRVSTLINVATGLNYLVALLNTLLTIFIDNHNFEPIVLVNLTIAILLTPTCISYRKKLKEIIS
ncbi:MAG: DUF2812 domain-containing protein [Clostridium sp.]